MPRIDLFLHVAASRPGPSDADPWDQCLFAYGWITVIALHVIYVVDAYPTHPSPFLFPAPPACHSQQIIQISF